MPSAAVLSASFWSETRRTRAATCFVIPRVALPFGCAAHSSVKRWVKQRSLTKRNTTTLNALADDFATQMGAAFKISCWVRCRCKKKIAPSRVRPLRPEPLQSYYSARVREETHTRGHDTSRRGRAVRYSVHERMCSGSSMQPIPSWATVRDASYHPRAPRSINPQ